MPNSPEYRLRLLSHACPLHGEHVPNVISVHPYRAGNWSLNVSPFHSISMHAGKESKEQCQLCLYVNNVFCSLLYWNGLWSLLSMNRKSQCGFWEFSLFSTHAYVVVTICVSSLWFSCRLSQQNAGLTDSTCTCKASLNIIVERWRLPGSIELQNVAFPNSRKTVISTIEMLILGFFCIALLGCVYGVAGKLFI